MQATQPSAQSLVLDILKSSHPHACSVRYLIKCGFLFEISENTMRVTLARLHKNNTIGSSSRGFYCANEKSLIIESQLWDWRNNQKIIQKWDSNYHAVSCQSLGRSNRSSLQTRERALLLFGFAKLEKDLYIRPNNLIYTQNQIKNRLIKLGLEEEAIFFTISNINISEHEIIPKLWQTSLINQQYYNQKSKLSDWLKNQNSMDQKKN